MNSAQPQQYVAQAPQSQYVTSMGQPQGHGQSTQGYFPPAKRRSLKGMAVFQIVMGALAVLLGLLVILLSPFNISVNGDIGTGMWVGGFVITTGIVGVIAAWKNGFGTVVACMVLNIICALMASVLVVTSAISIPMNSSSCSYYSDHSDQVCSAVVLAFDVLSLVIALSQFVITIICSALCCGAMCCKTQTHASSPPGVAYQINQPTNATPMMTVQYTGAPQPSYAVAGAPQLSYAVAGSPQPSYAVAGQGYANQGVFYIQGQVPHQNLQPNVQVASSPQNLEGVTLSGYHAIVNQ